MPFVASLITGALQIRYTRHTTNETVQSITACLTVSGKVESFQMRVFGHLAYSAPEEDHHRVIAAALRPPTDWRRPLDIDEPSG